MRARARSSRVFLPACALQLYEQAPEHMREVANRLVLLFPIDSSKRSFAHILRKGVDFLLK